MRGGADEGGNRVIPPAAAQLDKFDAVNAEWRRAIEQADSTGNPQALITYLLKTRRLGTIETFFLRLLLDRVTFKHKSPGNRVPFGRKSRHDINVMGAGHRARTATD